jgi:regulator of RNase E activity RraA
LANEDELIGILRDKLYVAAVSDILDSLGLTEQAMTANIRPITSEMRVIGRAHTVLTTDIYERPAEPYHMEIAAVDSLKAGDVMVACPNGSERTCLWGELLSTAARCRGATGAIIDGHTRDAKKIIEMDFPVFCTGYRPVDSSYRSQVVAFGVPVRVGGVLVNPGDIIFGDFDGIVAIPREVLEEAVTKALAKVEGENNSRKMLLEGYSLRDVFDKYGVL